MRSIISNSTDYFHYPSVRQFGSHFGAEHLQRCIRESNAEPVPRDLALDVRGPPSSAITAARRYGPLLAAEAAIVGALFDSDRQAVQIAIDEAITCALGNDELRALLAALRRSFHFADRADLLFSTEARQANQTKIDVMVEVGASRIRLAIHECDGRGTGAPTLQTLEGAWRTIWHCAQHPRTGLNLQLFIGCVGQTHDSFIRTLELAVANRPTRISLPTCTCSAQQGLGEACRELAIERLIEADYVYLGLGQLAAAEDELAQARTANKLKRTLLDYTASTDCDVIGLGMGAISRIGNCLSESPTDFLTWSAAIEAGRPAVHRGRLLDYDDTVRATAIDELMCSGQITIATLERRFALDFPTYFVDAVARLAALEQAGIVTRDATRIAATSRGRGQLRMIAACFDRYHETNTR